MLQGLTENHQRSLLASVQYAAKLIRDCDDVLTGAGGSDPLSRYTKALSAPREKIARDYLFRLRGQLLRALQATTERLIHTANDFIARVAAEAADVDADELPPELGFRARRQFYFTSLMHVTAGSPMTCSA